LLKNSPLANKETRISFVGGDITTCMVDDDWKAILRGQYFEDGFFLDRAIKKLMVEAYQSKSKTYPVFVVISDNIGNAIMDDSYADYQNIYPESKRFYQLKDDGKLVPHSLIKELLSEIYDTLKTDLKPFVRAYPNDQKPVAWLPDDSLPSIVLKNELFKIDQNQIKPKDWTSALAMQGKYISQTLHPEIAEEEWLNLVKYSFMSKIMNPFTSYMVVETEAQKAVLKKKQEQVLSGGKNLDLTEDARRMSEPGLVLMVILLGVFLWKRKTYK
jgi:hypothetical protein